RVGPFRIVNRLRQPETSDRRPWLLEWRNEFQPIALAAYSLRHILKVGLLEHRPKMLAFRRPVGMQRARFRFATSGQPQHTFGEQFRAIDSQDDIEERDLIGRAGQRNPTSGASLRPNEPGFGELLELLGQEMKLDVQVVAQLANGNVAVRLERNEIQGGAKTVLTTT